MNRVIAPAPVRKTVQVRVPAERAFAFFTARMGAWWRPDHSLLKTGRDDVVIEPRPGGRWYERAQDGSECNWGKVLAWDPPARVLLAWQLDGNWQYNPELVTEVEIRFIAEQNGGTRVELEHRHLERFGDVAEKTRELLDSPNAWTVNLAAFADLANREA